MFLLLCLNVSSTDVQNSQAEVAAFFETEELSAMGHIPVSVFNEIENKYTPFVISFYELATALIQKGWLDF